MIRVLAALPLAFMIALLAEPASNGADLERQTPSQGTLTPSPFGSVPIAFKPDRQEDVARLASRLKGSDASSLSALVGEEQPQFSGSSRPVTSREQVAAVQTASATDILFGIAAPFSGPSKELGKEMKLGIETAFAVANDAGGINGRKLKLIAADDGYEPSRTMGAMKELIEQDHVLGTIGNVGTPTAAVALPFALEHRSLFFGALTGANLLRAVPPDRYVFNVRPSYAEETEATVKYLVNVRNIRPQDIAVFAQQDAFGDAGYAGVTKALRGLNTSVQPLLLRYTRNTVDVDAAIAKLRSKRGSIKAVIMVAAYRAAAKFIEKTRDQYPALIYTNVSFVGSTSLANELVLLGRKYADGVIVTQVVPDVAGYSKTVLEYREALAKHSPGEAPDYISFEGYVDAKVLIEGIRRAGPDLSTERLIDSLESLHDVDLGLGTSLNFSSSEHQASHKIWGTQLNAVGQFKPIDLQ